MPKEDYLIRFLEELGRAVAQMLGFREQGLPDMGLQIANEVYKELFNIDRDVVASMSTQDFIALVKKANYNAQYLEGIAELTEQTAKAFADKGESSTARSFHEKSLQSYYLLNEKDKTFSFEREATISDIKQLLNTDH